MKTAKVSALTLCLAISVPAVAQEPHGHSTLFHLTDQICPNLHIREASPAALLDAQESFIQNLGVKEKQRLERAEPRSATGGYVACNGNGASCDMEAGMRAFRKTGLTRSFSNFACQKFSNEQKLNNRLEQPNYSFKPTPLHGIVLPLPHLAAVACPDQQDSG